MIIEFYWLFSVNLILLKEGGSNEKRLKSTVSVPVAARVPIAAHELRNKTCEIDTFFSRIIKICVLNNTPMKRIAHICANKHYFYDRERLL